jgi:hypothetical protein
MNVRKKFAKVGLLLVVALGQTALFAEEEGDSRGFLVNERLQGSGSSLGLITKFDTAVGYQFNRYLAIETGMPVYVVNPSSSAAQTTGTQGQSRIGNAHVDLRLSLANPAVNYTSMATVAAPTGDKTIGFSTGHATYDWNNIFDRRFGRVIPFASLGIANTVTDTPFFTRPFTSFGFVTHLEGGASYKLWRAASVGASVYDIAPSGQQTVFSKLIHGKSQNPGTGSGGGARHGHQGVFETASETVGNADIARDHGFSAWLSLSPSRYMVFEIGYNRSVEYALDSVFFGIDFNLSPLIGRRH